MLPKGMLFVLVKLISFRSAQLVSVLTSDLRKSKIMILYENLISQNLTKIYSSHWSSWKAWICVNVNMTVCQKHIT